MDRTEPVFRDNGRLPSYNQERFLAYHECAQLTVGDPPPFHIVDAASITGDLQPDALEEALNLLLARHPGLRMAFVPNPEIAADERRDFFRRSQMVVIPPGLYHQFIAPDARLSLRRVNLAKADEASRKRELAMVLQHESRFRFDFARPPLARATLVDLGSKEYLLAMTVHHLVSDIMSQRIIWRDLRALYDYVVRGTKDPGLPHLGISYSDFAHWQRTVMPWSTSLECWKNAWPIAERGQLAFRDFPFALPHFSSSHTYGAYEEVQLKLSSFLLRDGPRKARLTPFAAWLTAFGAVLHRWTRRPLLSVWSNFANRMRSEVADIVGWCATGQLIPLDCSGDPTLADMARRVVRYLISTADCQQVPFELGCRSLESPARFTDLHVMFDFAQVEQNVYCSDAPIQMTRLPAADLRRFRFPTGLEVLIVSRADSISLVAGYSQERFPALGVVKLLEATVRAYTALLENPAVKLSEIRLGI